MKREVAWTTAEEGAWPPPAAEAPPASARRRPAVLAVLALFLGLGGAYLAGRLRDRVDAAASRALDGVRQSHALVLAAGADADAELLRVALSGRDAGWTAQRLDRARSGLLWDRPELGLSLAPEGPSPTGAAALSPDLATAELRFDLPYDAQGTTITLRHTATYRAGFDRWLLAPPDADFWGAWRTLDGARVSLAYPAREEAAATRLHAAMEMAVDGVCQRLADVACPSGWRLPVRLTPRLDALAGLADLALLLAVPGELALPAITIVGEPVSAAGWRYVEQAYARSVAATAIARLVDYDCCVQGLAFRALLDWQLAQLALANWPLTSTDYELLIQQDVTPSRTAIAWRQRTLSPVIEDWRQVYGLVAFLLEEAAPEASAAALQRRLDQPLDQWLDAAGVNLAAAVPAWRTFIYARSLSGQVRAPSLPRDHLYAVCRGTAGHEKVLYTYRFATQTWQAVFTSYPGRNGYGAVTPVPGAGGFIVDEYQAAPGSWTSRLRLWRNQREAVLAAAAGGGGFNDVYLVGLDPAGRYASVARYADRRQETTYRLLDLADCMAGGCREAPAAGALTWSPDGARTLVDAPVATPSFQATGFDGRLFMADARGEAAVPIGRGRTPFWLDAHRGGYLRWTETGDRVVMVATAGRPARLWLGGDALVAALRAAGARTPPQRLIPSYVVANPGRSGQLLVRADDPEGGPERSYLFLVSGAPGPGRDIRWLRPGTAVTGAVFSANGRWLLLINQRSGLASLVGAADGAVQEIWLGRPYLGRQHSWSTHDAWLIQRYATYLLLLSPGDGYRHLLPLDGLRCEQYFWSQDAAINR